MKTIRIVNPRPGCAQFTSERAARKYVERRRIARWVNDQTKDEIFLYHDTLLASETRQALGEGRSDARRKGTVTFWNGEEDPDLMTTHRPGEVRC